MEKAERKNPEFLNVDEAFVPGSEERTTELLKANERLKQEVDKRKRAQAALEESERRYRDIFDNVSDFLYLHDMEGYILETNRAWATYGFDVEELRGLNIKDVLPERYSAEFEPYLKRVLGKGKDEGLMNVMGRDGREFVVEYRNHLVVDSEGRPVAVRGSGRDVTERLKADKEKKKLEKQLLRAQRLEALGTLAGGIAHNFNNLLMGIRGNASLGLVELDEESPVAVRLEKIEDLVDRGAELTRQLLAYAREGKFHVKRLDPNDLIKAVADTVGEARKDIRVRTKLADKIPEVEGDEGQIKQALMNLCVNSVEAMPSGGDLVIAAVGPCGPPPGVEGKKGPYVMLSVKDTGIGMDQDTVQRVFDPFFTTKAVGKGTGLGLASVYGIVESHGGHIRVDSEVGQGTSFDIYLPAAYSAGEEKERKLMHDKEGREQKTVLLVDDEDIIVEVGGQMVEKLGYKVITAESGREAIETYQEMGSEVDAVILDLIMPDMSGGETFDRLREIDPEVRVLLSSGYSIDGEASEILSRGCNGFIQKPFKLSDLAEKLREVSAEGEVIP